MFTQAELDLIEVALEHATQDVEDYLKTGYAEYDFEPEDLVEYEKYPKKWEALRKKIRTVR